MSTITLVTAEQLLRIPDDGYRYELVAGELRKMTPAGWKHCIVAGDLHSLLGQYVRQHHLGKVLGAEPGFLIARDPDTVRVPDIAFLRKDRLSSGPVEETFWPGAPDLAVEVVSPGDTIRDIDEKAKAWLVAGTSLVWVVNPAWRNVTVYRSAGDIKTLSEDAELTGEDVVPGFRCRVGDIFATA